MCAGQKMYTQRNGYGAVAVIISVLSYVMQTVDTFPEV
jgi:hypothetical protein